MTSNSTAEDRLSLDDDQRLALMKFRRSVADCCTKPYHDDRYLLRWLRARRWDVAAAEKMLRQSMEWRKQWEIDSLGDWKMPELYEKYYPYGLAGFDKEGSPVIVILFNGLDMYGILHASSKKDMIRATAKLLEEHLEMARQQANKHGPNALQLTCIIDMTEFNLKQFTYRPAAEIVIQMIQMYEANYPEVLKNCYIVNVPRVFIFAFNVVKSFLNDYTISKILLFRSDKSKWKSALLKAIDQDQLPVYFGGALKDPDGNPKCPSKIRPGGKVPKSMYIKKGETLQCDESYTSTTVKKGDTLRLPFEVEQDRSFLRWSFNTEGHDIKFGIFSKTREGGDEEKMEMPVRKVPSHETEEMGFIPCQASRIYTVVFDNRYSMLRSKKLNYIISVVPPIPKDQELAEKLMQEDPCA